MSCRPSEWTPARHGLWIRSQSTQWNSSGWDLSNPIWPPVSCQQALQSRGCTWGMQIWLLSKNPRHLIGPVILQDMLIRFRPFEFCYPAHMVVEGVRTLNRWPFHQGSMSSWVKLCENHPCCYFNDPGRSQILHDPMAQQSWQVQNCDII